MNRPTHHWLQPSLQQRTVLSVLAAFVLVFVVQLAYVYSKARQVLDSQESGLKRYGDALLVSLDQQLDESHARSLLAGTEQWVNIRRKQVGMLPGEIQHELRRADGQGVVYAPPALRHVAPAGVAGMIGASVDEQLHRVYEVHSPRWRLRVAEPWRNASQILSYNAWNLLPYLLLALPFVLVPVWLSARNGLKPLQQLADRIATRDPDDLRPIGVAVKHRELKPLAESLDALFERLRDKIARERGFVQDAAHELRTPLAVVTAQAHVMARSADAGEREQARACLDQAIARASHLARQLLVMATLEGGPAPALRRIDVAQAVRQLLAQAAPTAMAKGMDLSLDAPDTLVSLVDEAALESIVFNLVDNAVRYGHAGGNVVVTLRDDHERLTLQVQDDGPGIQPAVHERVFDRFWRGAGHDAPGSGLGLAIVRQAAARMRGKATLTRGLGAGGVGFVVSLPVTDFVPG
jgi:two-component system sensor histidine kinase QseC